MELLNVLGEKLEICGCKPMTGWYRDGYCQTDQNDFGIHTVCGVMTDDFLTYSKSIGNDLSAPNPQFGFKGLSKDDHWCLCAGVWLKAFKAGHACPVILESTHEETLAIIPLEYLKEYALK